MQIRHRIISYYNINFISQKTLSMQQCIFLSRGQFLLLNKKISFCGTFIPNKTTVMHKCELEIFSRQRSHRMITTKIPLLVQNIYLGRFILHYQSLLQSISTVFIHIFGDKIDVIQSRYVEN